jgi:beta-glucosidase
MKLFHFATARSGAWLTCVAACLLFARTPNAQGQMSLAAQTNAREMLARMTLEEKIGQMVQVDMNWLKDKADIQKYGIGSMLSGGDSDPADITAKGWRDACSEYQNRALTTRLKIPLLYGIDAVHGHNNVDGAVLFPQNIGLGATRDPSLVQKAARVTAEEVAGTAIQWAFAPCVAVAQDERWGRTYESYGERTELVTQLGAAAVRGFQQRLPRGGYILGCAKHFIGDGGTENGVDQGNTVCDEPTLRRLFLPPYAAAIKAGVGSIMVSYSSWNGKKMHGNRYLLTDVLKGELGFRGFLISDYAAIDQLSPNYKADIEESINAGLDMIMIPNGPGQKNNYVDFITFLKELISEGRVPLARVDDAVRRILAVKYDMGLFEFPFGDPKLTQAVGSDAHRKVARQCVRESLVLLKNDHHTLPLSSKLPQLTILGRGADDLGIQCGGWTISWQGKTGRVTSGGTTILQAIRKTVSPKTAVWYSTNGSQLADAKVVLVVVGELPYAEMKGDRKDLSLAPEDLQLVQAAKQSGSRVVTVVLSGRPLVLGPALEASDAVVAAWLPGTEGEGVVDVLFGAAKPTGKLPRTWPRTNEQLRVAASSSQAKEALFPYGYGLTY